MISQSAESPTPTRCKRHVKWLVVWHEVDRYKTVITDNPEELCAALDLKHTTYTVTKVAIDIENHHNNWRIKRISDID